MDRDAISQYPGTLNAKQRNKFIRHIFHIANDKYYISSDVVRQLVGDDVLPSGTFYPFITGKRGLRKALEALENMINQEYYWLVSAEVPKYGSEEFYMYVDSIPEVESSGYISKRNNVSDLGQYDIKARNRFARGIVKYLNDHLGVAIVNIGERSGIGRGGIGALYRDKYNLGIENLQSLEETLDEIYWPLIEDKFPLYGTPEFTEYIKKV